MVYHHVKSGIALGVVLITSVAIVCRQDNTSTIVTPRVDPFKLRSGDLVFRVGTGWRAVAVRLLSRNSLSHVGIAVIEKDGVHIVHAESPGEDGPGGVVDQTLAAFVSAANSQGVVAYRRTDVSTVISKRVADAALAFSREHIPFDDHFDLDDPKAFYCTELVLRASSAAGAPILATHTVISGGVMAGDYVFPRDLFAHSQLRLVD